MMDAFRSLARDFSYAARSLLRRPGFALIVILTLALGIGADTGIFSVVERVLLRPVPAPALDRLVVIKEDIQSLNLLDAQLSPGETVDLIARKDLFDAGAGYSSDAATLAGHGDPQQLAGAAVFGDFFPIFGARPYLGRVITPADNQPGGADVIDLTYDTWRNVFGSDPKIVGRSLDFGGTPPGVHPTVIGVLPPDFKFPASAQYFRAFVLSPQKLGPQMRGSLYINPIFRLRNGVTQERLVAGLRDEVAHWKQRFPDAFYTKQFDLRPQSFIDFVAGTLHPILLVLIGAVGLVLLITCANIAALQLLRAASRGRETAVRAALGAGRAAIVRQSLIESVLLALLGGALGIAVGQALISLLARIDIQQFQLLRDVHLDARVLVATALVSLAAGIVFGLAPALRAGSVNLQDALREGGRGGSLGARQHRFLQTTVIVQVALTLVLLLGSALTVRSLMRLLATDPGFRPQNVVTMRLAPPVAEYGTAALRQSFFDEIERRVAAIPGVQSVGFTWGLPFAAGGTSSPFTLPGEAVETSDPPRHANMRAVYGDYFKAMGIPVLRGRTFGPSDNDPNVVNVIIDEELATHFFHGRDPIGQRIEQGRPATIIGVVRNVDGAELGEPAHATVYYNYPQFGIGALHMAIRSSLDPSVAITQARSAVRDVSARVAISDVHTMQERIARSVGSRRLAMLVLSGFAVLALILAALGIYGVLSYITAQRTQEIGIRMALGADATGVARMVLRWGLVLGAIGVVAGFAAYVGIGRTLQSSSALESVLYGVSVWDAVTLASALAIIALAIALACWLPARRAAALDPLIAMRNE